MTDNEQRLFDAARRLIDFAVSQGEESTDAQTRTEARYAIRRWDEVRGSVGVEDVG